MLANLLDEQRHLVGNQSSVRASARQHGQAAALAGRGHEEEGRLELDGVERKTTTTVAMDFGRISISDDLVVYLFGTPGQRRFWFMWDELAYGALGAVVMADTRRLADCFPSIDYFERNGMPFVVAVNCFDEARRYPSETMRSALNLTDDVPLLLCDARQRASSRDVLVALVEHAVARLSSGRHVTPAR